MIKSLLFCFSVRYAAGGKAVGSRSDAADCGVVVHSEKLHTGGLVGRLVALGDVVDGGGGYVYRGSRICGGIGRKVRHKKPCIRRQFSIKPPRKRKSLTVQGDFDKIIDVRRTELCFLTV